MFRISLFWVSTMSLLILGSLASQPFAEKNYCLMFVGTKISYRSHKNCKTRSRLLQSLYVFHEIFQIQTLDRKLSLFLSLLDKLSKKITRISKKASQFQTLFQPSSSTTQLKFLNYKLTSEKMSRFQ